MLIVVLLGFFYCLHSEASSSVPTSADPHEAGTSKRIHLSTTPEKTEDTSDARTLEPQVVELDCKRPLDHATHQLLKQASMLSLNDVEAPEVINEVLQHCDANTLQEVWIGIGITDHKEAIMLHIFTHPICQHLSALTLRVGMSIRRDCVDLARPFTYIRNALSMVRLDLSNSQLGLKGATRLAQCGKFPHVKVLSLVGCSIGTEGGRALLSSDGWTALENLFLRQNSLGDAVFDLTSKGQKLRQQLHELDLSENHITSAGVTNLLKSGFVSLTDLDLSSNPIQSSGLEALIHREHKLPLVKRLALKNCQIEGQGISALARSPLLQRVSVLQLSTNAIGDDAFVALMQNARSLTHLEAEAVDIGKKGVQAILDSSQFQLLNVLSLGFNTIPKDLLPALKKFSPEGLWYIHDGALAYFQ